MGHGRGGGSDPGRRTAGTRRRWRNAAAAEQISKKPRTRGRRFKAQARAERGRGDKGVSQQDGDAGAGLGGWRSYNRRAPSWPTELEGEAEERDAVTPIVGGERHRVAISCVFRGEISRGLRPCAGDRATRRLPCHRRTSPTAAGAHCRLQLGLLMRSASALANRGVSRPVGRPCGLPWLHFGTSWLRSMRLARARRPRESARPPINHPSRGSLAQPQ